MFSKQNNPTALSQDFPAGVFQIVCLSCVTLVCFLLCTAVVGLLYPCLDKHLGEPHKFKREWASVMRCIAVFVGINHASVVSFQSLWILYYRSVLCDNVRICTVLSTVLKQQDVMIYLI